MKKTSLPYVDEYKELLAKIDLGDKSINESTMQEFLEKHTAFMPTPYLKNHQLHFNCFISKFRIGASWCSDIAYLTKSTVAWNLVLIELENPHKKIFKGGVDHAEFTAEFTHAKQQITDWKIYIDKHKNEVVNSLKRIRIPLASNRASFKYAIVMGRKEELKHSESRRYTLAELNEAGIRVLTYDTILSDYERCRRTPAESIVLTMYNEDRFRIKYLPTGNKYNSFSAIETPLFRYIKCEDISISNEHLDILKKDGYEMDSWINNRQLEINDRYTREGYVKAYPNSTLAKILR